MGNFLVVVAAAAAARLLSTREQIPALWLNDKDKGVGLVRHWNCLWWDLGSDRGGGIINKRLN